MRYARLFWGVLFVQVGVLLLLERWEVFALPWHFTWKVWPLALIAWGVSRLSRNTVVKSVAVVLSALAMGLIVMSLLGFFWLGRNNMGFDEPPYSQEFVEPFDEGVKSASLSIGLNAGSVTVGGVTRDLFVASTRSNVGTYALEQESSKENAQLRLSMRQRHIRWLGGDMENDADIQLNERPVWNLDFDIGAARLDADLTPYRTDNVSIDAGAARVYVRLGTRVEESHITIDAGAASIRLEVPEAAGCEVRVDGALTRKRFPGFDRIENGLYRTDNFGFAKRRIFIAIDAGASSMRVERY